MYCRKPHLDFQNIFDCLLKAITSALEVDLVVVMLSMTRSALEQEQSITYALLL